MINPTDEIALQGLTVIAIFISLVPLAYFSIVEDMFKLPICTELAVSITLLGSVMNVGA